MAGMLDEILLYLLLFTFSIVAWLPIYRYLLADWFSNTYIEKIEAGDIDLNWLLNDVIDEIVVKVKQNFLAEMGQLTRAAQSGAPLNPQEAGIMASQDILRAIGFSKNPPTFLTLKLADVLGKMAQNSGIVAPPEADSGGESMDLGDLLKE